MEPETNEHCRAYADGSDVPANSGNAIPTRPDTKEAEREEWQHMFYKLDQNSRVCVDSGKGR